MITIAEKMAAIHRLMLLAARQEPELTPVIAAIADDYLRQKSEEERNIDEGDDYSPLTREERRRARIFFYRDKE